jgi:hypothetical protein
MVELRYALGVSCAMVCHPLHVRSPLGVISEAMQFMMPRWEQHRDFGRRPGRKTVNFVYEIYATGSFFVTAYQSADRLSPCTNRVRTDVFGNLKKRKMQVIFLHHHLP